MKKRTLSRGEIVDILALVSDLASQQWQEADGSIKGAVGNDGKRFWFITDGVMQEVRAVIAEIRSQEITP